MKEDFAIPFDFKENFTLLKKEHPLSALVLFEYVNLFSNLEISIF